MVCGFPRHFSPHTTEDGERSEMVNERSTLNAERFTPQFWL